MFREIKDYRRYVRVWRDTDDRNEALALTVKILGSPDLAQIWVKSPLPLLRNVTPYQLISEGRSKDLLKYMNTTLKRYSK